MQELQESMQVMRVAQTSRTAGGGGGEAVRFWIFFKIKSGGFCGYERKRRARTPPRILLVCLFAWAAGGMESP